MAAEKDYNEIANYINNNFADLDDFLFVMDFDTRTLLTSSLKKKSVIRIIGILSKQYDISIVDFLQIKSKIDGIDLVEDIDDLEEQKDELKDILGELGINQEE